MPPVRALWHMLAALVEVVGRRLTGRSRRAAWPFGFELVVGMLRRNFLWSGGRPIAEMRAFNEAVARSQPFSHPVSRERTTLEGVQVEIMRPEAGAPVGTLLYLHGGSYLMGSTATHADLIARLALAGPFEVVSVEYRLAPEHEIEDAVADVLAVHRHVLSSCAPERVVWAGDSSGGGLVYLALVAARDADVPRPAAVATISPWSDLRCQGASFDDNEAFDWGTGAVLRAQAELVAKGRALDDPALSPVHADLRGLPPSLIHVGEAEIVLDPVVAFAERLREQGNEVELERWPDMVHDFHLLPQFHPDAQAATERLAAFLRERVRGGG